MRKGNEPGPFQPEEDPIQKHARLRGFDPALEKTMIWPSGEGD
jgi:hypothetical protein